MCTTRLGLHIAAEIHILTEDHNVKHDETGLLGRFSMALE